MKGLKKYIAFAIWIIGIALVVTGCKDCDNEEYIVPETPEALSISFGDVNILTFANGESKEVALAVTGATDRKSVVEGKSGKISVNHGGRSHI